MNWKEIGILVSQIRPMIQGLFVDRIIIPERPRYPSGFLKGEWTIRLTGRKQGGVVNWSIRPRQTYLAWRSGKGPKAAAQATHSPFDLNISKTLRDRKLIDLQALERERIVVLWFSGDSNHPYFGLVLVFIPAAPEAVLVGSKDRSAFPLPESWLILARSRSTRNSEDQSGFYCPPTGSKAPLDIQVRSEFFETAESYNQIIEKELDKEAFAVRQQNIQKIIRQQIKLTQERITQSKTANDEAQKEQDWQRLGDLLKASLSAPTELKDGKREVLDYETGEKFMISCDPKLSIQQQSEKFYQNSKRKQRRIQEAKLRLQRFSELLSELNPLVQKQLDPFDWKTLEQLERRFGVSPQSPALDTSRAKKGSSAWMGKSFISKDHLPIWVGRNKDENLELTFKYARGNDLWLHVRGRPGAHVVIPVQSGKSIPLDTLLDAAHLAIYYSGGQNWGKTEVDYTFKKYVKRIKDSTEASYTHNKTLLVDPDQQRLDSLLKQNK